MPSSKKLLLISYWATPIQSAASNRINSFIKLLEQHGWQVILVTANYKNPNLVDNKTLFFDKEILTCYKRYELNGFAFDVLFKRLLTKKIPNKLQAIKSPSLVLNKKSFFLRCLAKVAAWLNRSLFLPDSCFYCWYLPNRKKMLNIYDKEKPNLVLTSAMPLSTHYFGRLLVNKRDVSWFADFRDMYADSLSDSSQVVLKIKSYIQKRALKGATNLLTVSQGLKNNLVKQTSHEVKVIYNGFNIEDKKEFREDKVFVYKFIYTGKLYPSQYPAVMLFLSSLRQLHIKERVCFIGRVNLKELAIEAKKGGLEPELKRCEFYSPIAKEKLNKYIEKSQYYLHFDYKKNGILSLKVFDYMNGNKSMILFSTNPKSELATLVKKAGYQVVSNMVDRLSLDECSPNISYIEQFDRECQVKKLDTIFNYELTR